MRMRPLLPPHPRECRGSCPAAELAVVVRGCMRSRVVGAAARGIFGAMAMSGLRTLAKELGLVGRTPPEAIAHEGIPDLFRQIAPKHRGAAIELAHWGYGAAAGIVYAALPDRLTRTQLSGTAYGLAIWITFEKAIAPMLGLTPPRTRVERLVFVADHLLYGAVLSHRTL